LSTAGSSNSKFQCSENQKTPEKFAGFPAGWKKMGPLLRGAYARLKPGSLFFIPWNLLAPGTSLCAMPQKHLKKNILFD
jgi:hypothetical protein